MEKKNELKYLKWKISTLTHKYDEGLESWAKDSSEKISTINSLKKEIQHLKAEAKAAKDSESELKQKLVTCQANNKKVVDHLEKSLKLKSDKCDDFLQMLVKSEERSKKMLTEVKLEHEKMKLNYELSMQADFDNKLAQSDTMLKKKAEEVRTHQTEIEQIKKECQELEEKLKKVLETLQNERIENAEERKRYINIEEEKKKIRKEVMLEYRTKIHILKENIEEATQESVRLEKEIKIRDWKMHELKRTLEEKIKTVKDKIMEAAVFKKEKDEVTEHLQSEKHKNALLKVHIREVLEQNKHLEDKARQERSKNTELIEHMHKIVTTNDDLIEKNSSLKSTLKVSETNTKSLTEKVRKLEITLLRFKEDLVECMSEITEPKELKSKIIALKRRYVDEDESVQMDAIVKMPYQLKIECLTTKLEHCDKVMQNQSHMIKILEEQIQHKDEELIKTRKTYVKFINEEIRKMHCMKQELKETSQQLHKASKSIQKKVRSWLNKRVLQKSGVPSNVVEEDITLYPDDWQPPSLPDNSNIISPEDPPTDDNIMSESRPCTDDSSITHVEPFMNDGLPIVSI
uniref:cilia- and flagella-associated protein 57-like n=1 Tax=Scatophagus argus TaxID=75038 RepID=UPI001ED83343|nr:cilia- and flagella-associated protein 57-like [Scatophagus argus]